MERLKFLPLEATEAEVIRVDDACYERAFVSHHEPDTAAEDVQREFAVCHECNCTDVGQYLFLTYQVVAQNTAGWDFPRAHPPFPAESQPSVERLQEPCCPVQHSGFHLMTHQRATTKVLAWDSVKAHDVVEGPRQQYMVHQVVGNDGEGNKTGYDFVAVHDLL
jgi:hypothetical protein